MQKPVRKLISFWNGEAEVILPKNATDIEIKFEDSRRPYLRCLADPDEKEEEKYLLLSCQEPQAASDMVFLKSIDHFVCGKLYLYYKKQGI